MNQREIIFGQIRQNNQVISLSRTTHLMNRVADSELGPGELAAIIKDYPDITGRILFLANSAWASPRSPVETLNLACSLLGARVIRGVTISLSVSSLFNPNRCEGFDREYFWASSLLIAEGAEMLTRVQPATSAQAVETAYSSGLLHNVGLLWMAHHFPEQTSASLKMASEHENLHIHQAQEQMLGTDFCEVGARLAREWNMADSLVHVIGHFNRIPDDSTPKNTRMVSIAASVVSSVLRERPVSPGLADFGIKPELLEDLHQFVIRQYPRTRELVQTLAGAETGHPRQEVG